ncbi:hypothetical protein GCM10029992_48520 [Glycomyces albus]
MGANESEPTVEPSTTTSAPLPLDVPLANRISSWTGPESSASTLKVAAAPTVFSVLQNPLPE